MSSPVLGKAVTFSVFPCLWNLFRGWPCSFCLLCFLQEPRPVLGCQESTGTPIGFPGGSQIPQHPQVPFLFREPCGTTGPGGELMHFLIRPCPCLSRAYSAFQAPQRAGPGALRRKVTFTLICSHYLLQGPHQGRAGGRLGQAGPCQVTALGSVSSFHPGGGLAWEGARVQPRSSPDIF